MRLLILLIRVCTHLAPHFACVAGGINDRERLSIRGQIKATRPLTNQLATLCDEPKKRLRRLRTDWFSKPGDGAGTWPEAGVDSGMGEGE